MILGTEFEEVAAVYSYFVRYSHSQCLAPVVVRRSTYAQSLTLVVGCSSFFFLFSMACATKLANKSVALGGIIYNPGHCNRYGKLLGWGNAASISCYVRQSVEREPHFFMLIFCGELRFCLRPRPPTDEEHKRVSNRVRLKDGVEFCRPLRKPPLQLCSAAHTTRCCDECGGNAACWPGWIEGVPLIPPKISQRC